MLNVFRGNRPGNVNKAAKYAVVHGANGSFEVRLIWQVDRNERALLTTGEHPQLVAMVNAVKVEALGVPAGAFYLNEHGQVVVPADHEYYLAGVYSAPLEFRDGSTVLRARAPAGLNCGDPWHGPRPGIPYVLAAACDDIYYEAPSGPNRIRRYPLSDAVGAAAAKTLAQRLCKGKGPGGGRIYINEAREFFAPVTEGSHVEYRYLGTLDPSPWFSRVD